VPHSAALLELASVVGRADLAAALDPDSSGADSR